MHALSLHVEYGVVQRVRFECVCCVRVVCAGVCVSAFVCGVVSACVCCVWACVC